MGKKQGATQTGHRQVMKTLLGCPTSADTKPSRKVTFYGEFKVHLKRQLGITCQ